MAVFLVTWNPEYWDVSDMAEALAATGRASANWTTQSRKIRPGDVVVMLRQGSTPRGIVGFGRATAAPWFGGRRRWYVPFDWDRLEPDAPLVPLHELQDRIPTGHWTPRCSGTRVPDVEAALLLDLLDSHR